MEIYFCLESCASGYVALELFHIYCMYLPFFSFLARSLTFLFPVCLPCFVKHTLRGYLREYGESVELLFLKYPLQLLEEAGVILLLILWFYFSGFLFPGQISRLSLQPQISWLSKRYFFKVFMLARAGPKDSSVWLILGNIILLILCSPSRQ